ncbi:MULTISPECIES: type VI secretion system baseplate subunit TssE [Pseudomonas]|uniref:type VI secretion system baseplate subunit TssE n=1 Tax=Pseudomonas TaxID=286 RepID=UPI0018D5BB8A|nr:MULTISPECIES: type VI secretion system baseplate subunit TssE [Pseudomonas]MBH3344835.1 type VI secretion system baseplate subunit TssE [Pseudomonas parafulva]MEC4021817.1 type VI secretion system baseplate subunit TssE [Pseudomonas fulva]
MPETSPSLYEMLLQNFRGELALSQVNEDDQLTLSVLDNIQRILNSRAGSISHLPDYGLPDMGTVLQGLPASAHGLMNNIARTLRRYEPRLAQVSVHLMPQSRPGHLDYALDVLIKGGGRAFFGTTLGVEGWVVVRHLKQEGYLPVHWN